MLLAQYGILPQEIWDDCDDKEELFQTLLVRAVPKMVEDLKKSRQDITMLVIYGHPTESEKKVTLGEIIGTK